MKYAQQIEDTQRHHREQAHQSCPPGWRILETSEVIAEGDMLWCQDTTLFSIHVYAKGGWPLGCTADRVTAAIRKIS